jgi:hypothetical protein
MSREDILARIPERWGKWLTINPGWYDTVFQLDKDIAALDPNYTIAQVKEKFGGLRYYIETIDPAVADAAEELIRIAEDKVSKLCDECGESGKLRTDLGWYRTLCDTDYATLKEKKDELS